MPVFRLTNAIAFPPPERAREDGLLAVGGDLSPQRLIFAYQMGIFPWYSPGEPILWWAPDPRLVLFLDEFHLSRRLARSLRKNPFRISMDEAFDKVIHQCAAIRSKNGQGTWIDKKMSAAYAELHRLGYAHSVECWQANSLVGGLYGVSIGGVFFGESMFSLVQDSSKAALASLVTFLKEHDGALIDCQVTTEHLKRSGAREIPAAQFYELLEKHIPQPTMKGKWQL
jgi:leucyl/phenylalanyl-tRNA--protein transferase